MKTNKRPKFRFSNYKNLAVVLMVFAIAGAGFSAKGLKAQTPASVNGTSSWTKNSSQSDAAADTKLNVVSQQQTKAAQPTTPTPATNSAPVATAPKTTAPTSSSNAPVSAPAQPTAGDIAPESACPGQSNVSAAQTVLVCMTSYARSAHSLGSVSGNSQLMSAAASKAQDIINCGFSHTACGHAFDYWFTVNGYACGNRGENIAEGQSTPLEVFTAWMNSAGHRANILNGIYKDEGIAAANSSQGIVWVMELGGC